MKKLSVLFTFLVVLVGSSFIYAQSQVQSGKFSANSNSSGYTLDKNSGERTYTTEINFDKPFDKKPKVIIGVSMIDADTKSNVRYNIDAASVSRDGFTLKITTWSETKIFGIGGNWIAHTD